ncbi:GntR family transcriptional regulator [Amycolatopsis bartoniae]|uniref:GntR family transcriptional regulator n=1 Tax=Amycolatopsis bartoniae TaxID=941986 RepID=UPI0011967933|nr:GntR family transcriptional regulator [Amycolatopsis bartoniae]TVT11125.1 GntR family transcriptional regulator [Amycolatopsis bartoniae]
MRVVVDTASGVAPWRQVRDQIVRLAQAGTLRPGTRLPPIRQLARDLGLAAGTVARAYRELETEGWVSTGGARGTVIAEPASPPDQTALLREAASRYAAFARELGADADAAAEAVRAAYQEQ